MLDSRPLGDPRQVDALVDALAEAKQPLIVSGSGVIWSRAWAEMQALRREGRHPVLHDAAGPRRGAGRSSLLVPDDAQRRVPRCRPDHRARHADELHHRPCRAAALRRATRRSRASTSTRRRSRQPARNVDIPIVGDCKMVLQQLLDGIKGKVTHGQLQGRGGRSWPTARRQKRSAAGRQQIRRGRRHPSGAHAARRSRTSPSATRSCASTGRRR